MDTRKSTHCNFLNKSIETLFAEDYKKIEINEQVEVLNITGDISLYNNEIKIHAHVVVGKSDGSAHGHLLRKLLIQH